MIPAPSRVEVYDFGRFRLEVGRRVLRCDDSPVAVMPKVFDLLVALVRGRGLLLTKEVLMRQVWPATCVDEGSLARTVSRLRSLLGETGRGGPLETVSKSGYRFVADVRVVETADTGDRSLAIVPFSVVGPKSDESGDLGLGLGIADALITRLTLVRSLRVRPTSAVLALGGLDAIAAGRTLRVDAVLQGRLQLHGDVARTTVQLVSVAEERPVWAESFDEAIDDIYRLQDSIASRIVAALSVPISGQEVAFLKRPATTSAEAGRIYQQARTLTYRFVPGAWHRTIALYEVATELDPSFAAAHAGLASAYSIGAGTFAPTAEASAKAHAAIERALRLDDSLPEAYVTLGSVRFWLERDVEGGEAALRRGLAVSPNDVLAHHFLSWQLAASGRFAEASLEIDQAAELDPTSAAIAVPPRPSATVERASTSTPRSGTRVTARGSRSSRPGRSSPLARRSTTRSASQRGRYRRSGSARVWPPPLLERRRPPKRSFKTCSRVHRASRPTSWRRSLSPSAVTRERSSSSSGRSTCATSGSCGSPSIPVSMRSARIRVSRRSGRR